MWETQVRLYGVWYNIADVFKKEFRLRRYDCPENAQRELSYWFESITPEAQKVFSTGNLRVIQIPEFKENIPTVLTDETPVS